MKTRITVRILTLALLLCLVGCTSPGASEVSSDTVIKATEDNLKNDSDDQAEEAAPSDRDFSEEDYAQKNTVPVIKTDMFGYKNNDTKTAFFAKGEAGDIFYVVDADSGERVYQGKIEPKKTGDFSTVTKEGNYYIEASHIGRSCTFPVKKSRYKDTFGELEDKVLAYANKEDASFEDKVVIWNRLLQYYRDHFAGKKAAGIAVEPEEIQLLETSAKVLMGEADAYKSNTTAYVEELAVYSASMAMFYQTVKEYDETAAASYLAEAEDTYIQVEHEKAMLLDEAYLFYPAATLYCVTGKAPYESVAKDYLKENTERSFLDEKASEQALTADEMYLFGVMSYLNTTYKVDMNLCEGLMQNLSSKAEEFADVSGIENYYCVADDLRNRLLADRLYVIAVIENVIVSPEYNDILKKGIHYLGGCNETGSAYFSEYGVHDEAWDEKSGEAFLGSAYLDVLDKLK